MSEIAILQDQLAAQREVNAIQCAEIHELNRKAEWLTYVVHSIATIGPNERIQDYASFVHSAGGELCNECPE